MLADGMLTLLSTCPVSVAAIFTMPSVPAEKIFSPSELNVRARQLPLCRRVRHSVSMVPQPLLSAEESGSEDAGGDEGSAGRRNVCTCPEARPTERRDSDGWMAWAKRSEGRG